MLSNKKYGFGFLFLLISGLFATAQDEASPSTPKYFEEAKSGISSVYNGDWEYMVGGGVATFDCSSDGLPDVFLAGGTNKAVLHRNTSSVGGALTFKTQKSNLELKNVTGAYPLDVDADGHVVLVAALDGIGCLYRIIFEVPSHFGFRSLVLRLDVRGNLVRAILVFGS